MKKVLSLFMTMVMAFTMVVSLPNVTSAEDSNADGGVSPVESGKPDGGTDSDKGNTNTNGNGGNGSSGKSTDFLGEIDKKMKELIGEGRWNSIKGWFGNFGSGTIEFYNKVGVLGFGAFSVLAALGFKIVYNVLGFVARIIWPCEQQPKQQNVYAYSYGGQQ